MTPVKVIHLGVGGVGAALLEQYLSLSRRDAAAISMAAVSDIYAALWATDAVDRAVLRRLVDLKAKGRGIDALAGHGNLDAFYAWAAEQVSPGAAPAIVVDTTASDDTLPLLTRAASNGHGVVLANKRPVSAAQSVWDTLTARGRLRYEATVGAGLPVLYTLDYLQRTGDTVTAIDGMLSGTLGVVFSRLEQGDTYSGAIALAREQGFTEPDPRDDLGGMDVARKALILARTVGRRLELSDIPIEALYRSEWASLSVDEFMQNTLAADQEYAERLKQAAAKGEVLRYLAQVNDGGVSIGVRSVPRTSQFGALSGPDNLISITTARYSATLPPLRIMGPGAGRSVTAAGVLRDVLDLAQAMTVEGALEIA